MGDSQTSGGAPPLTFPCLIDIKAMGKQSVDFESQVRAMVAQHVPAADIHGVSVRPSRTERYLAVTVSITAQGYDQLHAIYQALSDCEQVLIAL